MKILGISCFYHDAAAALVIDGRLEAAAEEERFSRIKHDSELPVRAATWALGKVGIGMGDLDHVVFYDKPITKFDRILTGYLATPFRSYRPFLAAIQVWLRRKLWVEQVIQKEMGFDGEVLYVPHHLSHAASAFYTSPFEQAAVLTVDGVGEWATASYGVGEGNRVRLLAQMNYPHSVGLLYSALTYYLGFQVNSAEYKVMGLAPYGTPRYADLMERELVTIHEDGSIHLNMKYFTFHRGMTMTGRTLERLLGQPRREPESPLEPFHEDVAASIQKVTEKILVRMARHVKAQTGMDRLCMAGGVALNCTANSVLLREGVFGDIYIEPASGDAGGAIGAALYVHHKLTNERRVPQPFFGIGPTFDSEVETFLTEHQIPHQAGDQSTQLRRLAQAIAGGQIAGFYQGGAEFGPRALGFRSILADPRDNCMKEKINAAVKYREPFRPFAPAVMGEHAGEYFECDREAPYMLFNFTVWEDKRAVIPAVTHADNSSRIQTVNDRDNPVLYRLLGEFKELTGVPVLLNTSFNLRGHPIVNTPADAFATFCSGGIDILLLGSYLISKQDISQSLQQRFRFEKAND